ncbi:putative F-box protein At1g47790 isoform X2 [Solanum stenotomum]|uniref:putative F-box protein At1g47790 isoform X2 n=1 Tax=Solanum stenotomum TaxID=172797 RepID=UPI0020D131E0|nr:putative F-box protein At1g47790 isoform X2 [Solanum stenotomum]
MPQRKKKYVQICKEESQTKKRKLMDDDDHQAMTIHFQDEIIISVRSILRFKCVSKLWKTIICEPYFKMTNQRHAMNFKKILLGQWCYQRRTHIHP